MGCDIHMHVEVNERDPDGSKWQMVMNEVAAYGGRNYNVFSVPANVRNYGGPNGEPTITPISEPRGMPSDVSNDVDTLREVYGPDGHSHTWLLLSEVLAYDWTAVPHTEGFAAWAKELVSGPTRLAYEEPRNIRLVFWFDS